MLAYGKGKMDSFQLLCIGSLILGLVVFVVFILSVGRPPEPYPGFREEARELRRDLAQVEKLRKKMFD